jgi:hypothetical protein
MSTREIRSSFTRSFAEDGLPLIMTFLEVFMEGTVLIKTLSKVFVHGMLSITTLTEVFGMEGLRLRSD